MDDTSENGLQMCPTRIDGAQVLFAHKVNRGQCQDRQRGAYHKCFTCAYNNAYVQKHGPPKVEAKPVIPVEAPSSRVG